MMIDLERGVKRFSECYPKEHVPVENHQVMKQGSKGMGLYGICGLCESRPAYTFIRNTT